VLVVGFPAGALQANCYLLATAEDAPCVIVDPGQEAVDLIEDALAKHRVTPAGVLLSHGHFDHVFSVADVCEQYDVPAWIHPADRHLLTDPLAGLGADAAAFFGGKMELREPPEVREIADGDEISVAGLTLTVDHSPGHTKGSVLYRATTEEGAELMLAGDTLFAGSIGRMDLPGGDQNQMAESLRDKVFTRGDETVVLPGHGPTTTIGQERTGNPFVREMLAGSFSGPRQGL
jgi:glyoxylase-like metal-dependent hydrolase (beta-lactamase superfamily II)